jgi:uncharacterized protein involved in tellurium resistance
VARIAFGAAIYDAAGRRQSFRSVRGCYIRVLNHANGVELARYTLEVETGSETALVFGELYRHSRGWKFRAVGQGYATGLRGVIPAGGGEPRVVRPVEVSDYLRRLSPSRSRRSLGDHLNPPHVQVKSKPEVRPQARPQQQARPAPQAKPQPQVRPAQPSRPPESPRPPQPARSALDLSGPEPAAAAASGSSDPSTTDGVRTPAPTGHVEYGVHSSRYRQRRETVDALDDTHPATTWTAARRGTGGLTVTLRWEALTTASGLPRPSDLHLGAFWQAADHAEGVTQTLGNTISAPGARGSRQVLRLGRRDERDGQTIFVDLATLPTFRRFFILAYGQHGTPEWAALRPELSVEAPSGARLTLRPGEASAAARLCVLASFHVVGEDLIIRRENDYVDGPEAEAAVRYGWHLDWNPDGMTLRAAAPSRR